MTTFEDLLAPIDISDFERDTYGRQPLLIAGPDDRFTDLFSWDELNDLLARNVVRPPRLRLISKRETVDTGRFLHSTEETEGLNATGLTEELRNGGVMLIDSVHRLFPQLGEISDSLSVFTRAPSQINLYCGWHASKGFKIHWDRHDVWVMQIEGEKSWEIWEPTNQHPLPGDTGAQPTGDAAQTLTLTQGDLLYVPRGWWHRAEALDGVSVHMTLGSRAPTGQDFVRTLKYQLRDRPEWRSTLGADLDPSVQGELAELTSSDGLQAFLQNESARVWTRPSFNLPHAVTEPKPDITGSTLVKLAWTHGLEFRTNGDGTMRISSIDLHVEGDVALLPFLARLSGLQWQSIDEIAAGIEDRKLRRKLVFLLTTLEMKSALMTKAGEAAV